MMLRFRRLSPAYLRLVFRLPPGSRIRQALLRHAYRLGYAAFNRHDFEALLLPFAREAEIHPPREVVELGIAEPSYRGPEEYLGFLNAWASAWGGLRVWPSELIDLGGRILTLGETGGRGEGSGIPVSTPYASLDSFQDGQLIRHQGYFTYAEALEAVGLRE